MICAKCLRKLNWFLEYGSCFGRGLSSNQETGCEENLQNDLFCVTWDVKPYLNQLINKALDGVT